MAPSVEINCRHNPHVNLHVKEKSFFPSSDVKMNCQVNKKFENVKEVKENKRKDRFEKQFSSRKEEAAAIRNKFPTKIPIIVDRFHKESNLPQLDRSKFLVPQEITMSQLVTIIRKNIESMILTKVRVSVKNSQPMPHVLIFQMPTLTRLVSVCLQMDETVPTRYTRREAFYLHNTLLCLVKALEKRYTTIDLRNETTVTGKITEVDGFMNVTLNDAAVYDTNGEFRYFPMLHVQARNIRNVHIPDNVKIIKTIKSQVMKEESKKSKSKMTFKQSRARKQQKETLELIKKIKEEQNQGTSGDSK